MSAMLQAWALAERGAARWQSVLAPAGRQAARIDELWRLLLWTSTAVFALVVGALLIGLWLGYRRRSETEPHPLEEPDRVYERRAHRALSAAVAVSVLVLIGLLVASISTGRAIADFKEKGAPSLRLTGYQWWWEVEYQDPVPSRSFVTANEIHLPVGQPVLIETVSHDVIHSFWVPNLHGKIDLIPGQINHIWIEADRPGLFRGQCAEFCGLQHAHMGLIVVAESPADYAAWRAHQLQPASPPSDPLRARGQHLFESGPCALCHAVRGSEAGGRNGPDLTHLASRTTLAAATLPNRRGHLAGWILDPQAVKPGNHMPPGGLSAAELQAVLAYLEGLK
jgi:cytochrome c oxidase subunit II